MTDQLNIHGEVDQPRTWDGEPLFCPDTVREGLFDPTAFEQMPGQMAMEPDLTADQTLRLVQESASAADPGQPGVELANIVQILTRCHCCRQDFIAGQPMEPYCSRCLT